MCVQVTQHLPIWWWEWSSSHQCGSVLTLSECHLCYDFQGSGWHPLCSGPIHPFPCSSPLIFFQCHHLHSSTNLSVHPRHTFHLCFLCYSDFLSCPVILRAWEIFLCVGCTLLFELPPASNSRHQPVHCPLPVSEGTHPLVHPSWPLRPP